MISFLRLSIARRFLFVAFPLALCLLLLIPGISEAHAILLQSDPASDAVLKVAPSQVRMWFSQDLNPTTSTLSVLDSNGTQDTNLGVSLYTTFLDTDIGTNTINLQPDNNGHFSGSGDLSMGGNWQIRIQIPTPDYTLHETTVNLFTPS